MESMLAAAAAADLLPEYEGCCEDDEEEVIGAGRVFECKLCPGVWPTATALRVHQQADHSSALPYQCAICCKRFFWSGSLSRHMRIHSGSKPYSCATCGKCFTQSGTLQRHMRTHTGEKPYECQLCWRKFSTNSNLSQHMKTHKKNGDIFGSIGHDTAYDDRCLPDTSIQSPAALLTSMVIPTAIGAKPGMHLGLIPSSNVPGGRPIAVGLQSPNMKCSTSFIQHAESPFTQPGAKQHSRDEGVAKMVANESSDEEEGENPSRASSAGRPIAQPAPLPSMVNADKLHHLARLQLQSQETFDNHVYESARMVGRLTAERFDPHRAARLSQMQHITAQQRQMQQFLHMHRGSAPIPSLVPGFRPLYNGPVMALATCDKTYLQHAYESDMFMRRRQAAEMALKGSSAFVNTRITTSQ